MKKLASLLATAILATGCATVEKVPVSANVASAMNGKTIVRTTRAAKPDFTALTPAKGAFAMIGAFAAISAGNDLVRENNVPVPADAIGQDLAAQLQQARGMQVVATPLAVATVEPAQVAAAAAGKADYVLDVNTTAWMFTYYPTVWNHYKVVHVAQARLIDVAGQKVVAQGTCTHNPDKSDGAPTYDELVANQAAGLKKQLDLAAAECVASLKRDLFAL